MDAYNPCPKHNRKCNGFNGYDGNCTGFNGNYNGVYWCVMDSIGGMLNHIGKMPKTHYKNKFCNGFTGKMLMVYNGILMEIIGISVMVSIGRLLGHFAAKADFLHYGCEASLFVYFGEHYYPWSCS